eukprot:2750274-Pleurochrysis_carterae.AAC.3
MASGPLGEVLPMPLVAEAEEGEPSATAEENKPSQIEAPSEAAEIAVASLFAAVAAADAVPADAEQPAAPSKKPSLLRRVTYEDAVLLTRAKSLRGSIEGDTNEEDTAGDKENGDCRDGSGEAGAGRKSAGKPGACAVVVKALRKEVPNAHRLRLRDFVALSRPSAKRTPLSAAEETASHEVKAAPRRTGVLYSSALVGAVKLSSSQAFRRSPTQACGQSFVCTQARARARTQASAHAHRRAN